jgi:2-polyprenyl-3-methyl-5-hydroxy-6-metoxy-1,4-benzoquinol methylase
MTRDDVAILDLAREYTVKMEGFRAVLTRARPRICPFAEIIAAVPPGNRLLDIGSGVGLLSFLLCRSGRATGRVIGVDVNADAIAIGRAAARATPAMELRAVTSPDEWPPGPFDAVMMIDVLHHVLPQAQRAFFAEAARRVGVGGRLIFKDIDDTPFWQATWNRLHDLVVSRQWIHYVPLERVLTWGQEEGLKVLGIRRINTGPYGHELAIFARPNDSF